jgi:hypothetical protein
MLQRGVTYEEIEETLGKGKKAKDAKTGTFGKVLVFLYNDFWEGKLYKQKEVTVDYKFTGDKMIVLTVKARYGEYFEEE